MTQPPDHAANGLADLPLRIEVLESRVRVSDLAARAFYERAGLIERAKRPEYDSSGDQHFSAPYWAVILVRAVASSFERQQRGPMTTERLLLLLTSIAPGGTLSLERWSSAVTSFALGGPKALEEWTDGNQP
jgi:hypothetical protein